MKAKTGDERNCIGIVYHNAQSLNSKIEEIRLMASERNPKLMAFVETWLDKSHLNKEFEINSYILLRRDRKAEANRGGVCLYVNRSFKAKVLELNSHAGHCYCENLWVEISCSVGRRFVIGVIYRSPSGSLANFCQHMQMDLSQVVDRGMPIIIVGDFNVDLLRMDSNSEFYRNCMESFFLEQVVNSETRVTATSRSIIDHIWTDDINKIRNIELHAGFSDHKICYVDMLIRYKEVKPREFNSRSYKNFSAENYIDELKNQNWENVLSRSGVDECWEAFQTDLRRIIDIHAPIKSFSKLKGNQPWMTRNLLELIHMKNATKEIAEYLGTSEWCALFKQRKSVVDKETLKAKKDYWARKIEEHVDNPIKLWKTMKDLAPSCFADKPEISLDANKAEEFNQFFTGIADSKRAEIDSVDPCEATAYLESFGGEDALKLDLVEINEECTRNTIGKLPIGKAAGVDGIPAKALKIGIDVLIRPITALINMIIRSATFPQCLKVSVVTPIHKKGDPEDPNNNRPISVLPILSKVVERIIKQQLMAHIELNKLLVDVQHGFRPYHSTSTCLLTLQDDIYRNLEEGKMTGIVCLDLTKAFDMMDHGVLAAKLRSFFGEGNATKILINYLEGRQQQVKIGNTLSESRDITYGVPQGSILGPLLFLIFINDLPRNIQRCKTLLFADDTTLYAGSRHPCNIQAALNSDLETVKKWFDKNMLILNVSKTNFIMIKPKHMTDDHNAVIMVGGRRIEEVGVARVLGVKMDNGLTYESHLRELISNVKYRYRAFSRIARFLNEDTKLLLYNSVIACRLNYCDVVWNTGNKYMKDRLQTIQNRAARIILNSGPLENAEGLMDQLGWLNLQEKRLLHGLVLIHKLLHGKGPKTLTTEANNLMVSRDRVTRALINNNLEITYSRTNYGKKVFLNSLCKQWNRIPKLIRDVENSQSFKEKLYQHMLLNRDCLRI